MREIDGKAKLTTPDGLDIKVVLGIVFGDGAPRVEISSMQNPSNVVPIQAIDRAAKVFLFELTQELRKQAYRARPIIADPKAGGAKKRGRG